MILKEVLNFNETIDKMHEKYPQYQFYFLDFETSSSLKTSSVL